MDRLILNSMLLATIALPLLAARDPSPRRGFKRLLVAMLVFDLLYVALISNVVTRYVPEWFQ